MLLSQTAKQHHGTKHRQLVQHTNNATFTIFIYFIKNKHKHVAFDKKYHT